MPPPKRGCLRATPAAEAKPVKEKKKRKAAEGAAEDKPKKAAKKAVGEDAPVAAAAPSDASEPPASPAAEPEDPNALDNFELSSSIKSLLRAKGINALFPIQSQTLQLALDGNDIVGRARTGCGKTLAFVLPIVESLIRSQGTTKRAHGRLPAVIVLAPTRELAKQVGVGRLLAPCMPACMAAPCAPPPRGNACKPCPCRRAGPPTGRPAGQPASATAGGLQLAWAHGRRRRGRPPQHQRPAGRFRGAPMAAGEGPAPPAWLPACLLAHFCTACSLCAQVHGDFENIGKAAGLQTLCVYGGTPYDSQTYIMNKGVDVVVGTPGRCAGPPLLPAGAGAASMHAPPAPQPPLAPASPTPTHPPTCRSAH
jgi:hypothetical protein